MPRACGAYGQTWTGSQSEIGGVETVGRQVTLTVGVSQRRRKKQAESRRSLSLISAAAIVFVADRVTATQIRQLRRHFETIDGRIDHYIVNSESMAQEHSYSNR